MKLEYYIRKPNKKNKIERIASGIFSLDALTGGGIPKGKITIFEGNKSSGKTTVSLSIIGNFLRENKEQQVLYLDLEESFDENWASKFIDEKDMDRIVLVENTLYAEEAIDVTYKILNDSNFNIGLILLDSVANMIPIKVADKSAVDETVGVIARAVNKFFRKVLPIKTAYRSNGRELTLLLINQLRVKIGAQAFTSGYTKPGGSYQDFLAHLVIRFFSIDRDTVDGIPIREKYQFRIEKSKLGGVITNMKGEFKLAKVTHDEYNTGDIINIPYLINTAKKYEIIKREGNKWLYRDKSFKSLNELEVALIEDNNLFNDMYWYSVELINKRLGG